MSSKKRKSYFSNAQLPKRKKLFLQSGMKGFFCTSNGKEKDCIREALNLLDEQYSKICPKTEENEFRKEDIERELEKEVEELKNRCFSDNKPFQVIETDVKSCVFIKTTVNDHVKLATSIFTEIKDQKKCKSKFLIRLLPIEITCKAYIDDIKKAADEIFDVHFKCEPTTYAVMYNHRCNNSVLRAEVIEALCVLVRDRNLNHSVELKNPKKAILVEIIKGICCLSVLSNYYEFKKYNLVELACDRKSTDVVDDKNENTAKKEAKE
uniref:Putative thump domain-containing protein n=1 Tax=Rhodnius neglectus TaxID=72488 RepID=A0A0N7Z8J7_9HEMI